MNVTTALTCPGSGQRHSDIDASTVRVALLLGLNPGGSLGQSLEIQQTRPQTTAPSLSAGDQARRAESTIFLIAPVSVAADAENTKLGGYFSIHKSLEN